MSHFSEVKCQFKDAEILTAALVQLGFLKDQIQVHKTPVALRDYRGTATSNKASVSIRREHMGNSCSDIGWTLGEDSKGYVDAYQNNRVRDLGGERGFADKVAQEYAIAAISKQARAKGKVAHRVQAPNGVVKVFVGA